ncbi:hypothetical protein AB7C87_10465 [Natrarchaeobius sp. A-rgal3]|uniref:hypothetical protein n=1 Tax=Natrarchaeobius versutus TaxID=1679078 RepID=UPI0035105D33
MSPQTTNEDEAATYAFYPIVRTGPRPDADDRFDLETTPDAADVAAGGFELTLEVDGNEIDDPEAVDVEMELFGPGDVTALDERSIVREEPTPGTGAHPPTQFPVLEFGPAALPWLFSPRRTDEQGRTYPWLALVAVDRDHRDVGYDPVGPASLPVLEAPVGELPDPADSWAWAHAQVVGSKAETLTPEDFEESSSRTRSRLVCSRNLEANTRYRVCALPTFEAGRRVGLDRDPGEADRAFAWDPEDGGTVRLPVYHSWTFTAAEEGDFRTLADALDPMPASGSLGVSRVDVSEPGPASLSRGYDPDEDVGVATVSGALRSPTATTVEYDDLGGKRLRELLNREREIDRRTDLGVVAPPLYGRWYAGADGVATDPNADPLEADLPAWYDGLNATPRNRAVAGLGTEVVGALQEELMDEAWNQFDGLAEVNEYLARATLFRDANETRFEHLAELEADELLGLTESIHGHARLGRAGTVLDRVETDAAVRGRTRPSFRAITNPNGPIGRRSGLDLERPSTLSEATDGVGSDRLGAAWRPGSGTYWEGVYADADESRERGLEADPAFLGSGDEAWTCFAEADVDFDARGGTGGGSHGDGDRSDGDGKTDDRGSGGDRLPRELQAILERLEAIDGDVEEIRDWARRISRELSRSGRIDPEEVESTGRNRLEDAAGLTEHARELADALAKLLDEPPAAVDPSLTGEQARESCERIANGGDRLVELIRRAVDATVRGNREATAVLDELRREAASVLDVVNRLREALTAGIEDVGPASKAIGEPLEHLERLEGDVEAVAEWTASIERAIREREPLDAGEVHDRGRELFDAANEFDERAKELAQGLSTLLGESPSSVDSLTVDEAHEACERIAAGGSRLAELIRRAVLAVDRADRETTIEALSELDRQSEKLLDVIDRLRTALVGDGTGYGPGEEIGTETTDEEQSADDVTEERTANDDLEDHPAREEALSALDRIERDVTPSSNYAAAILEADARNDAEAVEDLVLAAMDAIERLEGIQTHLRELSGALEALFDRNGAPVVPTVHPALTLSRAMAKRDRIGDESHRLETEIREGVFGMADGSYGHGERTHLRRAVDHADETARTIERLRSALSATRPRTDSDDTADWLEVVEGTLSAGADCGTISGASVDPERLRKELLAELDPDEAFTDLAADRLGVDRQVLEARRKEGVREDDPLESVLASPTITRPMYEPLAEREPEWFLPGLDEIDRDSAVLLETNPEFVESYLTGTNHAFARELRWRQFPTDRKGTYFRRFWDRSANPELDPDDPEEMADIAPIHEWRADSPLGENPPAGSDSEASIVLLVRGELFQRYPNTTVYATDARDSSDLFEDPDDVGDEAERIPGLPETSVDAGDGEEGVLEGESEILFPEFQGSIGEDVRFFGFDLTLEEALSAPYHEIEVDDPNELEEGWFFVLEEAAAEPRFGLVDPEDEDGRLADPGGYVPVEEVDPPSDPVHVVEGDEERDVNTEWGRNAAHVAEYTWQRPYRVAIHASTMLEGGEQ